MDRMPEDVMKAAFAVQTDVFKYGAPAIARAILAERKRCADWCDREADDYKTNGFPQAALGCITTRKAILSGRQP